MAYSKKIKQIIEEMFQESDWGYKTKESEEEFLIRAGMEIDQDTKIPRIVYFIYVQENDVIIYSLCDIKSDSKNLDRMGEFINRINSGLENGNFEFDYEDGYIRYKIYIYVGDREINKLEIVRAIAISAEMWITYGDGIVEVLGSDKAPKDILAKIETEENDAV